MRRQHGIRNIILISLLVLASVAVTAVAGTSDAWLTTRVKIELFGGTGISTTDVNVDTVRGNVTLHGRVESEQQKARADEVVRKVDGVKSVRNLLQVVPHGNRKLVKADDRHIKTRLEVALEQDPALSDSKIEVKSVNHGVVLLGGEASSISDHLHAIERARRTPGVTGVASEVKSPDRMADDEIWRERSPARTSGRDHRTVISDLWITSDVKTRLIADGETPAMDINVDTRDGVVTLFGVVGTRAASRAAERDALAVAGVTRVVNALEVVAKQNQQAVAARDEDIQAEVERALAANSGLTASRIAVEVKNGVVRLTGTVANASDRFLALFDARSVTGVRSVQQELRVESHAAKAEG